MAFSEIDNLLVSVQDSTARAFDSSVMTGGSWPPLDTADIEEASKLWFQSKTATVHSDLVGRLLVSHAAFDLVFIAVYTILLLVLLRRLYAGRAAPLEMIVLLVSLAPVDAIETHLGWIAAVRSLDGVPPFWLLTGISNLKWLIVAVLAIALLVRLLRSQIEVDQHPFEGLLSVDRFSRPQSLGSAVGPQLIAVALFVFIVAMPAGGALEQLPDVLRYQLIDGASSARLLSVAALGVLALGVAFGGFLATTDVRGRPLGIRNSWILAVGVVGASISLTIWASTVNEHLTWGPLSAAIVVSVLALAFLVATLTGQNTALPVAPAASLVAGSVEAKAKRVATLTGIVTVAGGLGLIRASVGILLVEAPTTLLWAILLGLAIAVLTLWLESIVGWGGSAAFALVGFVVLWGIWNESLYGIALLGTTVAIAGGRLTYGVVFRVLSSTVQKRTMKLVALVIVVVVGFAFGTLMVDPSTAESVGTAGTLALGLGVFSLLAGALSYISRRHRDWALTSRIGMSPRPPWGTLLVVSWLLASSLTTEAAYHDARTTAGPREATHDVLVKPGDAFANELNTSSSESKQEISNESQSALGAWITQQSNCVGRHVGEASSTDTAKNVSPLLLIGAPGGGIRASYWTVLTLDALLASSPGEDLCRQHAIFAMSGVSGGSVGLATWLASNASNSDALTVVNELSADRALAGSMAGVFRDALQPMLGFENEWPDRAELLEDGWVRAAEGKEQCPFSRFVDEKCSIDPTLLMSWSDLEGGYVPVLIFNGSSVTQGCRALVTNTANLPTSSTSTCLASSPVSGPVGASLDVENGLALSSVDKGGTCTGNASISLITAAGLSARFSLVSPSGAIHRCFEGVDGSTSAFLVDGGYYENSGLLTLLEVWDAIETTVTAHNGFVARHGGSFIEPWFVLVDNHYASQAAVKPPDRPKELILPFTTFGNFRTAYGQPTFEQAAAEAMARFAEAPCGHIRMKAACFIARSRVVDISPSIGPSISAPLGWVLSSFSRADLDENLATAMSTGDVRQLMAAMSYTPVDNSDK
jgi:hypothetical protein